MLVKGAPDDHIVFLGCQESTNVTAHAECCVAINVNS